MLLIFNDKSTHIFKKNPLVVIQTKPDVFELKMHKLRPLACLRHRTDILRKEIVRMNLGQKLNLL